MELAIGQYTQQGPIGALAKICPLLKGELEVSLYKQDMAPLVIFLK